MIALRAKPILLVSAALGPSRPAPCERLPDAEHFCFAASRGSLSGEPTGAGMMDKIAVCAIFKDEAPYLLEWLAFHKLVGVDLFVLYDNGSSDGGGDVIRASSFAKNVTLIDWPD